MKNLKLIAFIVLALAQLYIPAQMIWGQEDILKEGKAFKFKTAPVDPNDPLRGKYVRLAFQADEFMVGKDEDWQRGEPIFVHIKNDKDGFIKVINVTREKPTKTVDFVKATVRSYYNYRKTDSSKLHINYPFNRFYMEESKALAAENAYREARRDTSQIAYGLVYIKDGNAVLEDVILNGVPIQEVVEKQREEK